MICARNRHTGIGLLIPLVAACSAGGATPPPGLGGSGGSAGASQGPSGGGQSMVASGAGGIASGAGGDANGTGGVTASGSGGASGSAAHDPKLFSWPEASGDASTGSLCQAGHYVGSYSCTVRYADAGLYPMTGPVDITLQESQNGEFLIVSGGTLKSAAGGLTANATVIGTLSCQSGAFSGHVDDGTLSIPPFPPGGTFTGTLNAEFVADGPKLEGSWSMMGGGPFAGYKCIGPWSATWQPS